MYRSKIATSEGFLDFQRVGLVAVYMQVDEKWHPAPVLRCARTSVYQWWEEHKEEVPKGFFRRTFDPLGVHGVYIYIYIIYIYIYFFLM